MIGQGAGPGMQYTQDPDQPADVRWVCRELHERRGGGAAQDIRQGMVVAADERVPLLGQGQDDRNVGDR